MPLLLVLLGLLLASPASAQTWYATPNTSPLVEPGYDHVHRLPVSVTFDWIAPAGWSTVNGATWDAIWPREARGAWYRMNVYTQPSIYKARVFPYPYSCSPAPTGFSCRDHVRAVTRYVACPATIAIGPLRMWRSIYLSSWREKGLFTADVGPFGAFWGRTLPFQSAVVTAAGQRINCQYGPLTGQGPGLTTDVWTFRWD